MGELFGHYGNSQEFDKKKGEEINYKYFAVSIGVSAVVGLIASLMIPIDFKFAVLAGYAGSDFLETLHKMKLKGRFEKELEKKCKEKRNRTKE